MDEHFDEGRKQLMIFNAPADVAETGLLSLITMILVCLINRLYLPSLKKVLEFQAEKSLARSWVLISRIQT